MWYTVVMNEMTWQAMLIDYNSDDKMASVLIQTGNGRLYPIKVRNANRTNIGEAIADIAGVKADRVMFYSEPRRRDQATVFKYLVMYDEMPTGVDYNEQ